jgi:hypothetical protein
LQAFQPQLAAAQEIPRLVANVDRKSITRTVADICKFVTDECGEVGGNFFYLGSKLAIVPKFERLRNWRTNGIDMNDYTLSDIFE